MYGLAIIITISFHSCFVAKKRLHLEGCIPVWWLVNQDRAMFHVTKFRDFGHRSIVCPPSDPPTGPWAPSPNLLIVRPPCSLLMPAFPEPAIPPCILDSLSPYHPGLLQQATPAFAPLTG